MASARTNTPQIDSAHAETLTPPRGSAHLQGQPVSSPEPDSAQDCAGPEKLFQAWCEKNGNAPGGWRKKAYLRVATLMLSLPKDGQREHLMEHTALFLQYVLPRVPQSVCQMEHTQLKQRVTRYMEVIDHPLGTIFAELAPLLPEDTGSPVTTREILNFLGNRVRTMPLNLLKSVASNIRKWKSTVDLLSDAASAMSPAQEKTLEALQKNLLEGIQHVWGSTDPITEDAAKKALTDAITNLRKNKFGYGYEAALPTYLLNAALNFLRKDAREAQPEQLPEGFDPQSPHNYDSGPDRADTVPILREWRARYLLAETFFDESRPRVKATWEWMLLEFWEAYDGRRSPVDLQTYVQKRTEESVKPEALDTIKRRLRIRLAALAFCRDQVQIHRREDSDTAMLLWVKNQYGNLKDMEASLRSLAYFARACHRPHSLHWARLGQLAVETDSVPPATVTAIRQDAERGSKLHADVLDRLKNALTNHNSGRKQLEHLPRLFGQIVESKSLVAAAWCLAVLDNSYPEPAAALLVRPSNPDPEPDLTDRKMKLVRSAVGIFLQRTSR